MMKHALRISFSLAFCLAVLSPASLEAQQHRATRLGNPATRFAPPLQVPEDLRSRFSDPKLMPDIASILNQWGWKGRLEDLNRAAGSAKITETQIPVGARMPFMSSRENGKAIILRDTLWAGSEPIPAYAFTFTSNGRRYRCVTPKPCSNFFLEDLGTAIPKLELAIDSPPDTSLCAPFVVRVTVRNSGSFAAPQVRVKCPLASGLKSKDNQGVLDLDAGTLQPGESRPFPCELTASAKGSYALTAQASSAEGGEVQAASSLTVRAPEIALECKAPAEVPAGRPAKVCLEARNVGDGPEPQLTITLPIPAGVAITNTTEGGTLSAGQVTWVIPNFAPQTSRQFCATFVAREPSAVSFTSTAKGECAPAVQAACETRTIGIPAILLETADVDDPIEIGKQETYIIRVTNQGTADLTRLRLTCALPASQKFISGSGPTPVSLQDRTITMEPMPSLAPKAVATWKVVVEALKAEDVRFKVEVRSDQFERPIPKEEATHQY